METFIYCGIRIKAAPTYPKYTLPADVPPPTGMTRAEFREWSKKYCGETCLVDEGQLLMSSDPFDIVRDGNRIYVAHPKTYAELRSRAKEIELQKKQLYSDRPFFY